jgi:hypothetical protein
MINIAICAAYMPYEVYAQSIQNGEVHSNPVTGQLVVFLSMLFFNAQLSLRFVCKTMRPKRSNAAVIKAVISIGIG